MNVNKILVWFAIFVLFVLVSCSLGLNALLLGRLYVAQQVTVEALDQGLVTVEDLKGESISYTVTLSQTVPVDADVPFKKQFNVRLKTTVPIKTEAQVPIQTPLGTYNVNVPIDAQVPIDTTIPIQIDQTLHVSTEVPLQMQVPIAIHIRETTLIRYLDQLQDSLRKLRDATR